MTKKEIIQFINENQACQLATVEGNQPRVRGMMTYRADEQGILFHTGTTKDLYKQLKANPKVELCYFSPKTNEQIRISGTAEPVEDQKLKEEIVANRPFMQPWIQEKGFGFLAVFRVKDCAATVWTMATNLAPKEYITL